MKPAPADRLFKAFADPTRLRILNLLQSGTLCVCDIIEVLRAPQARVSRHLGMLRRAGLVSDFKQGQWRHYSLVRSGGKFQQALLSCLGCCFDEVGVLRRDLERLKSLRARKAKAMARGRE